MSYVRRRRCLGAVVLSLCLFGSAVASAPLPAPIEQLACGADHILLGHVVKVDLVDQLGREVDDLTQGTGPGLTNTIRLHLQIDQVIVSNSDAVPKLLKVPLNPWMHFSLGQIRQAHAEDRERYLILLQGRDFQPVVQGAFLRSEAKKDEVLELRKRCR